jgi:hypothetical protein
MNGTKLASYVERGDHMKRPSLSTTRRPVVLLVQPSHDDSLDTERTDTDVDDWLQAERERQREEHP